MIDETCLTDPDPNLGDRKIGGRLLDSQNGLIPGRIHGRRRWSTTYYISKLSRGPYCKRPALHSMDQAGVMEDR